MIQAIVNGQLQISSERTIPLSAIKFISASNLKDDWFSLGIGSPQEADPLINCVFKTEFFTQLERAIFSEKQKDLGNRGKPPKKVPDLKDPPLITLKIANS